jgi:hypothetical protein
LLLLQRLLCSVVFGGIFLIHWSGLGKGTLRTCG